MFYKRNRGLKEMKDERRCKTHGYNTQALT